MQRLHRPPSNIASLLMALERQHPDVTLKNNCRLISSGIKLLRDQEKRNAPNYYANVRLSIIRRYCSQLKTGNCAKSFQNSRTRSKRKHCLQTNRHSFMGG